MIPARFKSAKFWLPLLGSLALGAGAVSGAQVPESDVSSAADQAAAVLSQVDGLWAAGSAALAAVAGWFGRKGAEG